MAQTDRNDVTFFFELGAKGGGLAFEALAFFESLFVFREADKVPSKLLLLAVVVECVSDSVAGTMLS